MQTIEQLVRQLREEGGAIVNTGACSEMEIADARSSGRYAVDEDGFGYVRRYKEWLRKIEVHEETSQRRSMQSLQESEEAEKL